MGLTKRRYCYEEVLPFATMISVECANVGMSTLFKAASTRGMSYRVYVVYSFAISALSLVPITFIFHRKTALPPFSLNLFLRICLLAVLGFSAQMLGYKGINYASPTLSSAISNLTPAFTFALAILFGMEKLVLRSSRSQAKVLGTLISISGALVVVLYEGPAVIRNGSSSASIKSPLQSPQSDWLLGGLFLTGDYLLISIWYIVQAQTVRMYPAESFIVLLYSTLATILSAPICYLLEPNPNSWKINTEIMLLSLLYAGIVGSSYGTVVHTWGLRVKGPVYVALFRPLSIAIAAIFGVLFLGDNLFLGSVIGAVLISMGFYIVMWGKARDDSVDDSVTCSIEAPSPENVPLLR